MIIEKIKKTISKYGMIKKNDRVVIGISGGPDSVCLTHFLYTLREELGVKLYLAHFNHCLRGRESDRETLWVKAFANKLKIPLVIEKQNVLDFSKKQKISTEEAARILRYDFFAKVSRQKKANKIALGHNADDQVETILMWLIRGTGKAGFSGIPPARSLSLKQKKPLIIRPAIEITRQEIEQYLKENNLSFCTDSSNLKPIYLRNKIRLNLLPYLKKYNPRIKEHLLAWSEIFRDEENYLKDVVDKCAKEVIIEEKGKKIVLDLNRLLNYNKALQRRIFYELLDEGANFKNIEKILALIHTSAREKTLILSDNLWVKKENRTIIIGKERYFIKHRDFLYVIKVPGETKIPEANNSLITKIYSSKKAPSFIGADEKYCAYFDWDVLKQESLQARNRMAGDRFKPFGFFGSKKIKSFFIDEKVSSKEKNSVPLLVSGKDIIWIIGFRRADKAKITDKTKNILEMKVNY